MSRVFRSFVSRSFFFSCVLLATIATANAASVKHLVLNGYDTYFINTGKGNGVALTVAVQAGSLHDEPVRQAGRAHLWEHVIHGGSKNFPGQTTMWAINKELGSDYNAYTADNRIFYHHYIHPSALPKAMQLLGSMMSEPEWNPETFKKELQTVKNEALEYQQQDGQAMRSMSFIHGLPEGHPFRMYNVGTQDQLNAMTLDDLKELYYTNYVPGSMQIIVAGNFDTLPNGETPLTDEALIRMIVENFHQPQPDRAYPTRPLREKEIPGFGTGSNTLKIVKIGSKSGRPALNLKIEVHGSPNDEALETVLDYLNTPQATVHKALRDKGWIVGAGFGRSKINNLEWVDVNLSLTPAGEARYEEITQFLFSAFARLATQGLDESTLEYLRQKNVISYEDLDSHPDKLAETFASKLSDTKAQGKDALKLLNFKARYSTVTNEQVKEAARAALHPDSMLMTLMQTKLESENVSPIFGRTYQIEEKPELLTELKRNFTVAESMESAPLKLELPNFKIQRSENSQGTGFKPIRVYKIGDGIEALLKENHRFANGALVVSLRGKMPSAKTQIIGELATQAFMRRYATELGYFEVNGVKAGVSTDSNGGYIFNAEGNSLATKQAVLWLMNKFATFKMTSDELRSQKESFAQRDKRFNDQFTANLAQDIATRVTRNKAMARLGESILTKDLTLDEFNRTLGRSLASGDLLVAANGDYSEENVNAVAEDAIKVFPKRLSSYSRSQVSKWRNERFIQIKNSVKLMQILNSQKSETAFGRTWTFQGPELNPENIAALSLLQSVLHEQVFSTNRIQRDLGYVHGFTVDYDRNQSHLILMGQTEGADNFPKIEEGWIEVLNRLHSGELTENFDSAKTGVLRARALIPRTLYGELSQEIASYLNFGKPNSRAEVLEALKNIDASDVTKLGMRYLGVNETKAPRLEVVLAAKQPASLENCKNVVNTMAAARKKLTK